MTKGDLARYPSHHRIASVERESRLVRVVWDDGHVGKWYHRAGEQQHSGELAIEWDKISAALFDPDQ